MRLGLQFDEGLHAMHVTAELRLWWPCCHAELKSWWAGLPQPARIEERTDIYLRDLDQTEIGIKCRDAKRPGVEIKHLVAMIGNYRGKPLELWVKSDSPALSISEQPAIAVHKARQLKDFGDGGASAGRADYAPCHIELAEIACEGDGTHWWTLGFEAAGPVENVHTMLQRALQDRLVGLPEGIFSAAKAGGYPFWLARIRNHH